jgi:RNA polymerase sigma-70 factor (ECF subfamily)
MGAPTTLHRRSGQELARTRELERLLAGVADGSQSALAELYDLCHRPVFALALRIVKDRQAAEDVLLDVFLQVWRGAAAFDRARGPAFHWLLTLARSRALDAVRARRLRRDREAGLSAAAGLLDGGEAPPEHVHSGDRSSRVRQAIAQLPGEQAQALDLAYFQDHTHAAIAARLGVPLGTVKTRIRLAMLKLREKLKNLEEAP